MKLTSLQAASYSSPSSAVKPIRITQSGAARQSPLTRSVFQGYARLNRPDGALMATDSCGQHDGTTVTCTSPAACAFSSTFRACRIDHPCPSSASDTACLPYENPVALIGIKGPETRDCTETSSSACVTLSRATTLIAPDQKNSMSQAGQGSMVTTSPQTPALPSTQPSNSPPLLKPPAGTILEAILGVTVIFVLVIISCIIIARKVHSVRTVGPEADGSRSSLTVLALPGQEGRDADIPLSSQPGTALAGRESKADRPRDGDGRG